MAPKKELNSGQVVNLISGEAFLLADSFPYFIMGLSGPFQVVSKYSMIDVNPIYSRPFFIYSRDINVCNTKIFFFFFG